jgi:N-methylhydantoinase A
MSSRSARIGIDVGGTFTDAVLLDGASGRLHSAKAFTTPADRSRGVIDAIRAVLAEAGTDADQVAEVVHGSTTGTNALIERTGARTGLLVTAGFRDILEIGRVMRPAEGLYDMSVDRPPPLVPRRLCLEAGERIGSRGEVLTPLDEDSVREAGVAFARMGVEAVAICFLFSFLNPAHERRAAEILATLLPDAPISASHAISPEYREYERASTTVMNGYLTPVMNSYLDRLKPRIEDALGGARLFIIQANGGATTVENARQRPVATVNSGPAGGVVAAAWYGRAHGRDRIVSVDMGGTSFDIGLVEQGASQVTTEGNFQGLPVKLPIIDLHIIGAGGGSIAWVDAGGALNVGPRSAGAEPGPACYGRGGTEPTVTDANLVLGRLDPKLFHGGRTVLDAAAAHAAVKRIADVLKLSVEEAALGIVKVVNANMVKGIATVTVQRGIDVREFALLSFGGAGGVHAIDIADALDMAEVIVPPHPGVFSAIGLLAADMRHDYVVALGGVTSTAADPMQIEMLFQGMENEARRALATEGFSGDAVRLVRSADLKVVGQTYELTVPLPQSGPVTREGIAALIASFGALYRERYAFFFEGEAIELVNLRLAASGLNEPVRLTTFETGGSDSSSARIGRRPVYFEKRGFVESDVYQRDRLRPGMKLNGPVIVEEPTSVTLIPLGRTASLAGRSPTRWAIPSCAPAAPPSLPRSRIFPAWSATPKARPSRRRITRRACSPASRSPCASWSRPIGRKTCRPAT